MLKDVLQKDLVTALKGRDELRVSSLRSVIGAVQSEEKGGKTAVVFTDQQVEGVIKRLVKQRKESAEIYENAGAADRAARELAEAEVLEKYLPEQLGEDAVAAIVSEVVAGNPDAPFGVVMKLVMGRTAGKADGKLVSTLVRNLVP